MKFIITILLIVAIFVFMPFNAFCIDEILIGISPEENIFKQFERHKYLADYLSKKLGIKVKLTILSKYGDIIDNFVARRMDGAFFEVFTSVLAMEKLGVEPIARYVNLDGSSTIKSYIFVRKDSGIRTAKDMKGKRIAFVDKATVTGYLFAITFLKDNGINEIERYFKEYYFTGSHDSAVYAVFDRRADIGTAKSKVYEKIIAKDPIIKDELRIISESREFPEITLCIRKDLPVEIKTKIKDLLLNIDKEPLGKEVISKMEIKGFVATGITDFKPFFDLANKAGIDIRTYRYR